MKLLTMTILSQIYKAFCCQNLTVSVDHLLSCNTRLVEPVGDILSQSQPDSLST